MSREQLKQMVAAVLLLATLSVIPGPHVSRAADPRSADAATSKPELQLVASYQALRRLPQRNPYGPLGPPETLVPPDTRAHLRKMKSSLSAVVAAVLEADGTASLGADELRSRIVAHLDQLGIKVVFPKGENEDETAAEEARQPDPPEPEVRYPHGEISTVEVRTFSEPAEFAIVAPVIRTGAGWESPIYLFRRAEQNWRLMLVDDDPPDYEGISSDHEFALSPADAKGNVFIVAANFSGGLGSTVVALEYRVVRPGRNPSSPKTLLRGDTVARRMYGPYFIRTQADGFEIEFPSDAVDRNGKFDTDEITGTRLLRFKVGRAAVKLVDRRQLKPREFPIPASAD